MLSSGHLLDNRYRLDERIATGGMGDVWRGTDVVLGRVIAVKVLRTAMLTDPEFAARFYGEARMMAAFRHPGVVEVYDYASAGEAPGEDDQVAYLVMAFVDGEPLSSRLKDQGSVPVAETMSIVAQAAEALHAAHLNGTIHRDVKPGNLIVKPNGTVILVDFGVARSAAVTSVTALNAIVGTALYMAPEQVAKGNVTPATDIYALGAVAYHCIAGRPPFDGDNALQVALRHLEDDPDPLPETVPPAVRALVTRAMAKDPADRFESAAEFAEAALAAAGPMDFRSLTGTQMTAPTSPAGATRAIPLSRSQTTLNPHQAAAYATGTALGRTGVRPAGGTGTGSIGIGGAPPARRRSGPPRSQLALGAAVLVLFLVAIGLAVAIKLNSSSPDDSQVTTNLPPSAANPGNDQPKPSDGPTFTTAPTRAATRPNNPPRTTTRTSVTPTATKPTTTPPTTKPTTTPPTTTPVTSPPTTDPPTDPPTTGDTDPGGGGGVAGP